MDPLQSSEEDFLDIHYYWQVLRRRWKIIASIAGFGTALTIIYLLVLTPLYTATTEILIDSRKKNIIEGSVLSDLDANSAAIASEVKLIKSPAIAKRVIEKLNLERDPEFNADAEHPSVNVMATILDWIGIANSDAKPVEKTTEIEPLRPGEMEQFAASIAGNIKASQLDWSSVIAVSFTSKDREKAARITNEIASAYLVDQLEAKFEATSRANQWLRQRLDQLQKNLQTSEKAVEAYRAKHNLVGSKGQTPFQTQLEELNRELILARVNARTKLASLEQVQTVAKSKGKLTSIDIVVQSDVVQKLRSQMTELSQKEAELRTRFTQVHPKVVNVRSERRDLARQIEREARRIVSNLKNEYEISQRRVASLEQSLQELQQQSMAASSTSVKLRELELQASADRAIYQAFLNRFKETSQQETLQTSDTRVISAAIPPKFASYPKKRRTTMLAFIGFMALGVGFAFMLEKLDNSFKTGDQIEETLGVAHLSSIPNLTKKDLFDPQSKSTIQKHKYVLAKPLSTYSESIRALKIAIQLSNVDAPPRIIMVSSSLPNEGKSTISANLAELSMQAGQRTLLIDADLRNPSLTRTYLEEPKAGLVELLSHQASPEQVIIREDSGLDVLPTLNVPQNTAEILGSNTMKELMGKLAEVYDLIIVDSSPITPVVDGRVLAGLVDSIVVVCQWDKTPRDAVTDTIKLLNVHSEKIAGIVLNNVDLKRMSNYGYSSYYNKYPHYYGSS